MSLYAMFHEAAMRGCLILFFMLVAYLFACGLNAAFEAIRGGRGK